MIFSLKCLSFSTTELLVAISWRTPDSEFLDVGSFEVKYGSVCLSVTSTESTQKQQVLDEIHLHSYTFSSVSLFFFNMVYEVFAVLIAKLCILVTAEMPSVFSCSSFDIFQAVKDSLLMTST